MYRQNERTELISAFREYLEDLQDTGVDWLDLPQARTSHPLTTVSLPDEALHVTTATQVSAPEIPATETLAAIRTDLGDCRRCPLCQGRINIVFGVGSPDAAILFVGEAPGEAEDIQGEPFVGEAGQLLTKIIAAMGFTREQVYIGNVLKCRPPGNRNPHHGEIEACTPFLLRQVRSIRPQAIIALGTFAAQTLLQSKEPISRLRGKFHDYHGIPLMPTFHPAFLLRSPERKRDVWNDIRQVMKKLGLTPPQN
jgi:uracil-DNA glycosylase